ncbi:MAG: hypothetical protein GC162_03110 [Planctomycetes bacterium]|nr:hypothetical protein [Planctomycetota bacterium]
MSQRLPLSLLLIALFSPLARADEFKAQLDLSAGDARQSGVEADGAKLADPLVPRPVLHLKVGQLAAAHWKVSCISDQKIPNMLVHFYIAGEDHVGDRTEPDLSKKNVAVESAVSMDFEPGDATSADMPFRIDEPGAYRVQIETLDAARQHQHEHASVMDIIVEADK